jgi:hypothetical protein
MTPNPGFLPPLARMALLSIVLAVFPLRAQPRAYLMGSLGEAPMSPASDIGGSGALPQAGASLEYPTRFLTPYLKAGIGRYNQGAFFEGYLGIQAGAQVHRFKPSLTFGIGAQSFNRKEFAWESDDYRLIRESHLPTGFGIRLDAWERCYGEWEIRNEGMPWWKLEFGYRVF